jgi:chromate transporter
MSEVFWLFLRLGATAFGGPAAHVALMEQECVAKRRWLTREEFLDLYGATNLIPGPNSTEMAIHLGRLRAGLPGLAVAGIAFILPAALAVSALAWGYLRYGARPQAAGVAWAMRPVVVAVVAIALGKLGRTALKSVPLALLAACAFACALAGVHEMIILGAAALIGVGARAGKLLTVAPLLPLATAAPFSLGALFLFFLKVGSVLFGSGYVLLAFLRGDLVERWHWLTESQLLDAITVGQFTPGPVLTTATFIGWLLGGPAGATLSTVGIFLPAFVLVALSAPLIKRLRASATLSGLLDGVNVASLALMAAVTIQLGRAAILDGETAALALGAFAVMQLAPSLNSAWLLAGAALFGAFTH